MTWITTALPAAAQTPHSARGLFRWVCTSNPFYVLSAGLFLAGLWASVESQPSDVQTFILMAGLIGYTLLLAVTGCLLVRLGGVWDDVRTVLLLVVLMFLATSVTFDESLVEQRWLGWTCYLVGWAVAVAVSEGILLLTRLRLPGWFRVAYHLFLALFFLYPLGLSLLVDQPRSEALMWALFGFSPAAGLISLTLLPAIRRGADYVKDNGSPWRWPLYPWVLFGVLGFAVMARAFLLCWSMHLLVGRDSNQVIFGPYFLVPFGFAIAVPLLELALVTHRPGVYAAAMTLPLLLIFLAAWGHQDDVVYRSFLKTFTARLGGDPLSLTVLATAAFYAYSSVRGVSAGIELATLALLVLAFVGPDSLYLWEPEIPQPMPLAALGVVQMGLGLARRSRGRCLIGSGALVAALAVGLPESVPFRGTIAFHLVVLVVLLIAAVRDDDLGRFLRFAGCSLGLLACLIASASYADPPEHRPDWIGDWAFAVYPLAWVVVLAGYGFVLRYRSASVAAGVILGCWLAAGGVRGYAALRRIVPGIDFITLSLILFGLALLISLGKAGVLARWLVPLREKLAQWQGETAAHGALAPATAIQREPPGETRPSEEIRPDLSEGAS